MALYYIDYDAGSDSNNGTSTGTPWKHCPGDAAATDTAAAATLAAGDTVRFKGGVIYRGGSFAAATIEGKWSGSEGSPITYVGNKAGDWGTGAAIIDGSTVVTGWAVCATQEEALGNPNYANIWKVARPSATNDILNLNLFQDDVPCVIASDPQVSDPFFFDNRAEYATFAPGAYVHPDTFTHADLDQASASYWDYAYIALYTNPSEMNYAAVETFDPDTDTIVFADLGGSRTAYDGTSYWMMFNHIDHLTAAGEYVLVNGVIYFWPFDGDNPNTEATVTCTAATQAFGLKGFDYLTFDSLTVQKYSGPGWANGCAFFNNTSGQLCYSPTIQNCTIRWCRNGDGTQTTNAIDLRYCQDIVIKDNLIYECPLKRGMTLVSPTGAEVTGNTVHDMGGTGIYFSGVVNGLIARNLLYDNPGIHGNGITLYSSCDNCFVYANNVSGSGVAEITIQDSTNLTFMGNILRNQLSRSFGNWSGCSGLIALNNTMNDVTYLGTGWTVIKNNIFHNYSPPDGANSSNNWNTTTTAPALLFTDDDNADYSLKDGTLAIDSGVDVSGWIPEGFNVSTATDYAGTTWPDNVLYDGGALEYASAEEAPVSLRFTIGGKQFARTGSPSGYYLGIGGEYFQFQEVV